MDLARAFAYIFEDEEWVPKLAILVGITWLSAVFAPLLVGLVGVAALLGYLVELVRNVRQGHPRPLPRWENYGSKISQGGSVLVGVFVYSLPNLLLTCCVGVVPNFIRDPSLASAFNLAGVCCVLPLLLIYNLVTWPMLGLGIARYADEGNVGVFFQFGDLFGTAQRHLSVTLQWVLFSFVVNFALGLLGAIPCIGWLAAPALAIPVHGYLLGQFAEQVEEKSQRKARPRMGY